MTSSQLLELFCYFLQLLTEKLGAYSIKNS